MREISRICRERGVLLHMDMVHRLGNRCRPFPVDAAGFAAHKFDGRKGGWISFPAQRSFDPADHVRRRARK